MARRPARVARYVRPIRRILWAGRLLRFSRSRAPRPEDEFSAPDRRLWPRSCTPTATPDPWTQEAACSRRTHPGLYEVRCPPEPKQRRNVRAGRGPVSRRARRAPERARSGAGFTRCNTCSPVLGAAGAVRAIRGRAQPRTSRSKRTIRIEPLVISPAVLFLAAHRNLPSLEHSRVCPTCFRPRATAPVTHPQTCDLCGVRGECARYPLIIGQVMIAQVCRAAAVRHGAGPPCP